MICVYCETETGDQHDEHAACVEASLAATLTDVVPLMPECRMVRHRHLVPAGLMADEVGAVREVTPADEQTVVTGGPFSAVNAFGMLNNHDYIIDDSSGFVKSVDRSGVADAR